MVRGFDHCLQFLTGVEGDDASSRDRNFLTRLGVASRSLRLFAELEIAETGQLDAVAGFERDADFLEEALDHILGFALVEPELLEKQIRKFGFGERHWSPPKKTLAAQHAAESILYFPQQYRHGRVDFGVRQSTCSILYKHQNCKAFFAGLNPASAIDVEERDVVHRSWLDGDKRIEHRLGRNAFVDHDREVAAHDG